MSKSCSGSALRSQESSDRWARPSAPPRSTKTPKLRIEVTLPRRTSPSVSSPSRRSFCSARHSCMAARSERMARLRRRLISITFMRSRRPTWSESGLAPSLPGLAPTTCDMGMKVLTPSTLASRPPLLKPVISASKISPLSKRSCRIRQPCSPRARSIESWTWPSLGLRLHDVDEHVLADAKPGERVRAERVHLLHGHDALGLRADVDEVDEDAVALDAHHRTLDDLATTQLARFGRLAGVEQRAHVEDLFLFLGLGCGGGCDGRFRAGEAVLVQRLLRERRPVGRPAPWCRGSSRSAGPSCPEFAAGGP